MADFDISGLMEQITPLITTIVNLMLTSEPDAYVLPDKDDHGNVQGLHFLNFWRWCKWQK